MAFWIRDPKNHKPSVTLTLLVVGFVVCLAKLIVSDMAIGPIHFSAFTGTDFALAVGAVSALYWGRKVTDREPKAPVTPDGPPVEGPGQ
jgi:hypothetical protein